MIPMPDYPMEDIEVRILVPKDFTPIVTVTVGLAPIPDLDPKVLPISFAVATSRTRLDEAIAAGASPSRLLVTLLRGITQVFGDMAGKSSESDVVWEIRPEGP